MTRYQLANGLEVVLMPEPDSPRVVVDIWFRGGSGNELPGQSGYAHLFEHMILRGSEYISKARQNAVLSSIGADRDGSTGFDFTELYAVAAANQLETLLWLRSDQLGFSASEVTTDSLATEREVVLNEIRMRDGRPFGQAHRRMFELLFPKPHPYHGFVLGSVDDVQQAKPENLQRFFETYGSPNHAILVIGGGFRPEAAKALVEKYFGTIPRGHEAPMRMPPPPPIPKGEQRDSVTETAAAPRLTLAWLAPPPHTPERTEVDLFPFLLSEGASSLLQRRMVHTLAIADSVSCNLRDAAVASVFYCDFSLRRGVAIDAAIAEVDKTLTELRTAADTAILERAKTSWRAGLLRDIEDLLTRTQTLSEHYFYTHRTDYFAEDLKSHAAVGAESLRHAVTRWLSPEHRVIVTVNPAADR